MIDIYDNFMPDGEAIRSAALAAPYIDWQAPDGQTYKRVALSEVPGLQARIEDVMGPVDMLGMGYRLNYNGELPNAAIHSDIGWGTHALVLYLNHEGQGGTAFWSHQRTGADRYEWPLRLEEVSDDWNTPAAWRMRYLVPMYFNRAIIYESAEFHSRYPFPAFGHNYETGRLVAVAFFTPRSKQ